MWYSHEDVNIHFVVLSVCVGASGGEGIEGLKRSWCEPKEPHYKRER